MDLLLRHGRIVTVDRERRILVDGAIAIEAGRVAAIGPDREVGVGHAAMARETRDLGGALVHPGLVDAHVHTANEIARGFAPKTHMDMDPIDLAMFTSPRTRDIDRLGTLLSSMEMVVNGTTAFSDTGSAFDLEAAAGQSNRSACAPSPATSSSATPTSARRATSAASGPKRPICSSGRSTSALRCLRTS